MTAHQNFDHRAAVTWVRADETPSATGWYYQRDSLGRTYMTKSPVVASLAVRYKQREWACVPHSYAGFLHRELLGMERVDVPQDAA